MILPTKHITPERSLLGVSALILQYLNHPQTLSRLWDQVRSLPVIGSYDRFILALDLLYLMEAITFDEGLLRRKRP